MADYDVDLFVIGAGSGGVRAARIASSHGARVMIAEEYRVGGTCVIRGCVPKKLLVYASRFAEEFEDAKGFGWTLAEPTFDWATLIANKDKEIDRLEKAYIANLDRAEVTIVYRGDNILRGFDEDVRNHLRTEMEKRGIRVLTKKIVEAIEKVDRGLCVELSDHEDILVDKVMFATGRRPNVKGIGLEAAGVRLDERGAIAVNEFSQTNVP